MSGKTARKDRKKDMKIMNGTADPKDTAKEQAVSIRHMIEERDKKAFNAKEHLISQLDVTIDKYRTANGVMAALGCVREILNNSENVYSEIQMAQRITKGMSVVAEKMIDKAMSLEPWSLDELCDSFYDHDVTNKAIGPEDMAKELMILQLCQNVGPDAEDIVEFYRHADEEIDKARDNLKKFCEENELDFLEVCGEK